MNADGWELTDRPGIYRRKTTRGLRYKCWWRGPDGTQRTKTFERIKDAENHLHDVAVKKVTGSYVDPRAGRITIQTFAEHWLDTELHLKPKTREVYGGALRAHILPALGDRTLAGVTKAVAKKFVSDMVAAGKGKPTVAMVVRVAHRLFQVAVEEGRLAVNPWTGVKVPRLDSHEPRFLTGDEIRAIAGEVPDPYRTLVLLLGFGGLRIGEAAALKVRAIDFDRNTLRISEAATEVNGKRTEGAPKTATAIRTVDLPPSLARMLKDHVATYSNVFDPDALVFTTARKTPILQSNFRKLVFQPAATRAKISPTPRVHDLRHSAASIMAAAGLTLVEAAAQLGHSATVMTQRYSHVFPSHREGKMAALDSLLTGKTR
jgi:integrase